MLKQQIEKLILEKHEFNKKLIKITEDMNALENNDGMEDLDKYMNSIN